MSRNQGKAVPDDNDPILQHNEFGPDRPSLADIYRLVEKGFDRNLNLVKSYFDQLDELMEKTREKNQC